MKKIALDLDGVIFDSENLYRVYSEIYDVDVLKKNSLIDNETRIYQNRYNWSSDDKVNFYNKYAKIVLSTANFMAGADTVLSKLSKRFDLVIVTSRNKENTKYAIDKLEQIGLNIEVFSDDQQKINRLKSENCDYIIDDDMDICINAASEGIKALYFKNAAARRIISTDYIITVNNWGEIYKFFILDEG